MTDYPKWKWEWNVNTILACVLLLGMIIGFFRWTNGIETANTLTNTKFDNAVQVITNWIDRHEQDISKRREETERRNGAVSESIATMQRAVDKGDADTERLSDRVTAADGERKEILNRLDRQTEALNSLRDELSGIKTEQEVLKNIVISQGGDLRRIPPALNAPK